MNSDSPHIHRKILQGQEILFPDAAAWQEILRDGFLDKHPIPLPDHIPLWLKEYGKFEEASLGVRRAEKKSWGWSLVPFLHLGEKYLRVLFEHVICEHCERRCGPSATPQTVNYAGTGLSIRERLAEFDEFPVQSCPHCKGVLRQRQTVWLAYPQTGTADDLPATDDA